jgi:hypothetical protein
MSNGRAAGALIHLLGERLGAEPASLESLDWADLIDLARRNRVAPLAQAALAGRAGVPETVRTELLAAARRSFVETSLTAQALRDIVPALGALPWVVLRGPVLGASLYGDLMLRPFGDLDILVAPECVAEAAAALRSIGLRLPERDLPEAYYRRYHLHLRLVRPGQAGPVAVELHWALDHPFTLFTVDVAGILARRREVRAESVTVSMPCPDDLILTLSQHTVKHAVQLPYWTGVGQAAQIVRTGSLLQLYDIALALRAFGSCLNWQALASRAVQWGVAGAVRACLDAIGQLWPEAGPASAAANFAAGDSTRWQRATWRRIEADQSGLFGLRRGVWFRPVRLLDALQYVNPPAEFLRRRYGSAGLGRRVGHGLGALGQLGTGLLALAYYAAIRRGA